MYCEQCGAKLAQGDKFCVQCGTKVPEGVIVKRSEERETTVEEQQTVPLVAEDKEQNVEEYKVPPKVKQDTKKAPDDTQELNLGEDPTAQPEPVMVFVHEPEREELKDVSVDGVENLKIAVLSAAVVVTLLLAFLLFLLVSGWGPSGGSTRNSASVQTTSVIQESTFEEEITEGASKDTGTWYRVSVGSGNRLSLRAQPDEDSRKLDRIDNGTQLKITETRGNWGKTTYAGQTGWVCMSQDGDQYVVKE